MDERTLARFKSKFFVLPNECWYWTGTVTKDGYAVFHMQSRPQLAHRVSYKHFVEPIPSGLHIDHLCHTWDWACSGGTDDVHRRCPNPRHLEAVEPIINSLRGARYRDTRCINGHEWTPENTYVYPSKARACKTCRVTRMKKWLAKNHPDTLHGTETDCPQGHPYSGANLLITVTGGRACRECKREWSRTYARVRRAVDRGYIPLAPGSLFCPGGHFLGDGGAFVYQGLLTCLPCVSPGSRSFIGSRNAESAALVGDVPEGALF